MATTTQSNTFNVLCLHGCCQSKDMLQSVLKNFIEICKKDKEVTFNFVFVQAEYPHPDGGFTWYHVPLVVKDIGKIKYSPELVNPTLDSIDKIIKENNINVLMGFSQGGNVVDCYLKYREHPQIKKAVIMSSYSLINDSEPSVLDVKVLNVVSKIDEVVPWNLYPKNYVDAQLIEHEKGHKIPGNVILRQIKDFIKA